MTRQGEAAYSILQFDEPGKGVHNIGILLLDLSTSTLYWKLREDWESVAQEEDIEVLSHLGELLEQMVEDLGDGEKLLENFEDTLSNSLLMTDRKKIQTADLQAALEALYAQHVSPGNRLTP